MTSTSFGSSSSDNYSVIFLQVRIDPVPGKKVEHTGVKIELLGQIGNIASTLRCRFVTSEDFSSIIGSMYSVLFRRSSGLATGYEVP